MSASKAPLSCVRQLRARSRSPDPHRVMDSPSRSRAATTRSRSRTSVHCVSAAARRSGRETPSPIPGRPAIRSTPSRTCTWVYASAVPTRTSIPSICFRLVARCKALPRRPRRRPHRLPIRRHRPLPRYPHRRRSLLLRLLLLLLLRLGRPNPSSRHPRRRLRRARLLGSMARPPRWDLEVGSASGATPHPVRPGFSFARVRAVRHRRPSVSIPVAPIVSGCPPFSALRCRRRRRPRAWPDAWRRPYRSPDKAPQGAVSRGRNGGTVWQEGMWTSRPSRRPPPTRESDDACFSRCSCCWDSAWLEGCRAQEARRGHSL